MVLGGQWKGSDGGVDEAALENGDVGAGDDLVDREVHAGGDVFFEDACHRLVAPRQWFSGATDLDVAGARCEVEVTAHSRLNQARLKLGGALLESAASAHRDAAAMADHRRRHFTDAFDEYNSGAQLPTHGRLRRL